MSGCWTGLSLKGVQAEKFHTDKIEQEPEIYVVLSQSVLDRLDILSATVCKRTPHYSPKFSQGGPLGIRP